MKLPSVNVRLPEPPRPVPPDQRWTFGGLQRMALREACPPAPRAALTIVEREAGT